MTISPAHTLSRRKLLQGSGALIVGFAIPPVLLDFEGEAAAAPGAGGRA